MWKKRHFIHTGGQEILGGQGTGDIGWSGDRRYWLGRGQEILGGQGTGDIGCSGDRRYRVGRGQEILVGQGTEILGGHRAGEKGRYWLGN